MDVVQKGTAPIGGSVSSVAQYFYHGITFEHMKDTSRKISGGVWVDVVE